MTGTTAAAIASRTTFGKPSRSEGNTKQISAGHEAVDVCSEPECCNDISAGLLDLCTKWAVADNDEAKWKAAPVGLASCAHGR